MVSPFFMEKVHIIWFWVGLSRFNQRSIQGLFRDSRPQTRIPEGYTAPERCFRIPILPVLPRILPSEEFFCPCLPCGLMNYINSDGKTVAVLVGSIVRGFRCGFIAVPPSDQYLIGAVGIGVNDFPQAVIVFWPQKGICARGQKKGCQKDESSQNKPFGVSRGGLFLLRRFKLLAQWGQKAASSGRGAPQQGTCFFHHGILRF